MKLTSTLFLVLTLLLFNCSKKEDDNTSKNAILLYLVDQASGNCVSIAKDATSGIYTATPYLIPKGGCNAATLDSNLYSTSASEAKTAADTVYDGLSTIYDGISSCSGAKSTLTTLKAAVTEASLTTAQTGLTSGNKGCIAAGLGYRINSGKASFLYICKDATSVTAFKALTQYQSVSSVTTDMAVALKDQRDILTKNNSTNKFSTSAISALRLPSTTELATKTTPKYLASNVPLLLISSLTASATALAALGQTAAASALQATITGLPTCTKDTVASDSSVKAFLTKQLGSNTIYGISDSDASGATETITDTLRCYYGGSFTEVTTQYSVAQKCPSSYPSF